MHGVTAARLLSGITTSRNRGDFRIPMNFGRVDSRVRTSSSLLNNRDSNNLAVHNRVGKGSNMFTSDLLIRVVDIANGGLSRVLSRVCTGCNCTCATRNSYAFGTDRGRTLCGGVCVRGRLPRFRRRVRGIDCRSNTGICFGGNN